MSAPIALDGESYFDKVCSVKTLGAWAYCHHPDFYVYLMSVYDGTEKWVGSPADFNWNSLDGEHVLAHNMFFEKNWVLAGAEKGLWPFPKWAKATCTANMTAAICNRRSLKDSVQFLLGEELSKDARTNMSGVHWADVKDTDQGRGFIEYAGVDAVKCWELFDKFGHCWSPFEQELSNLTIDQCIHGVQIDTPKLTQYLEASKRVLHQIECHMPWVLEGEKPTGTKAIAMMCREAGIPTPPVKSHEGGEEKHEQWMKNYSPKFPWIDAIGQWRSVSKLIATLETIERRLRPDGTFSFGLKYFGAHTGRWSGDAGVNLQNLRRDPVLVDMAGSLRTSKKDMEQFYKLKDDGARPEWLGHDFDVRSLLVPRPGYKFVLCDLAQIEPRVLAWCAQDEKMLSAIREGYGVYEAAAIARGLYSGEKGGFKKLKALYQMQKGNTLALGYGCAWEKYIEAAMTLAQYDVCKNDDIDPTTGKPIYGSAARREVAKWREDNPKIPALWKALDNAFRESLGSDFILELPSGRILTYRNVQRRRKKKSRKIYDDDGNIVETKIEESWSYTAEIDGRRYDLYGGLLVENLVQATARDVFAYHLLLLRPKLAEVGGSIIFTAHDESICEIPVDVDSKFIQEIHSTTPPWLPGCPILGESKESMMYLK